MKKQQHRMQCPAEVQLSWLETVVWLVASVLIALAIAWIATLVSERFAPFIVFPMATGAVLGAALVGVARLFSGCKRSALLTAVLMASLVAVCAQHCFCYLDAERKMQESKNIDQAKLAFAEIMRDRLPSSPFDYLRAQAAIGRPMPFGCVARDAMAWLSWAADGLLLVCAAMLTAFFIMKTKVG